jgi:hypothetical protein
VNLGLYAHDEIMCFYFCCCVVLFKKTHVKIASIDTADVDDIIQDLKRLQRVRETVADDHDAGHSAQACLEPFAAASAAGLTTTTRCRDDDKLQSAIAAAKFITIIIDFRQQQLSAR